MTQTYNADAIEVLTGLEPVRRRPGMYTDTTRPNHLGQEVIDNSTYNADAIEVLTGLEPVRRRPGMYTDTTRPNHLGQEVIDNSVDEALAGHAKRVDVILHADQSLEVIDDGRGMPVDIHPEEGVPAVELILCRLHAGGKFSNKNYDIHPEEGVPAVELILCRLHAGGKFSNKNYQFSGGLHGVGISVVNALSKRVEVNVRRDGQVYNIAFENGEKVQDLQVVGTCGKRNTGTSVHYWPDETVFDSPRWSVSRLTQVLKAKAVLCPGVEITFKDGAEPMLMACDRACWTRCERSENTATICRVV